MKYANALLVAIIPLALMVLSNCQKEEEPFEYPDTKIEEPTTVTQMTRKIHPDEAWEATNSESGCEEDLNTIDFAFYELGYSRGYATMHLKPDVPACDLMVGLSTAIKSDEVASSYWKNWKFELTFSELQLDEEAKLWLTLNYREVKLVLDLAPYMREVYQIDTNFVDTNGVFTLDIDTDYALFKLNGKVIEPDFSDASGNVFEANAQSTDQKVDLTFTSKNASQQSVFIFNFVRITSYGIPES